jgi:hypothetical protein
MRSNVCVIWLTVVLVSSPLAGAEVGYRLTGNVTQLGSTQPYGIPIPIGTSVTIQFVYDPSRPATHPNSTCDCLGYQQDHINGFWAEFGGVRVQADSYLVQVSNNIQFPGQQPYDSFSVAFSNAFSPPLAEDLIVEELSRTTGLLSFTLSGDSNLFAGPSLPQSLNPGGFSFPSRFNAFADNGDSSVEVLYTLNSLQPIELLTSDHDLDGDVDGRDFIIWQRYFSKNGQNGDSNFDGHVDSLDLDEWQFQYGESTNSLIATGIPEPSTFSSSIVLLLVYLFHRSANSGKGYSN